MSDDDKRSSRRSALSVVMDNVSLLLRTLILINGGAAVAILTFAGNLAARSPAILNHGADKLPLSMFYFGEGVAYAGFAMLILFVANFWVYNMEGTAPDWTRGERITWMIHIALLMATFMAAAYSLGLFVVGIAAARYGLTSLAH